MALTKYMRAEDQLESAVAPESDGTVDPTPLLGTWINTNSAADGIVKVILATKTGALRVHAFGACDPNPCDWGEVNGAVFGESISSRDAMSFTAVYDFAFMEVILQAYVVKGVLVIVSFTAFKDDSGRSNYVGKEFFYRQ